MNEENTKKLVKEYPTLYRDVGGDPRETCMTWGFECGDGWYNIVDSLSAVITNHEENSERFKEDMSLRARYNRLIQNLRIMMLKRFHPEFFKSERVKAVQVKEKFGSLRYYMGGHDDYVAGAVAMAEAISAVSCEKCGRPGRINDDGMWMQCLCDQCRLNR